MLRFFFTSPLSYNLSSCDIAAKVFFVIWAKDNLHFKCIKSLSIDKNVGVLADQIIELQNYYSSHDYPDKIRRIKFYDPEYNRT